MRFDLQTLRGDIFGGIAAAVVSLPLALAFGVASGLGPVAGLYGAIIFSETTYLDDSAALVVDDLATAAQTETRGCVVTGLSGPAAEALEVFGIREHLPHEHFVPDLETAKKPAWELVNR